MLCLSGFELYSRWVPLTTFSLKLAVDTMTKAITFSAKITLVHTRYLVLRKSRSRPCLRI